MKKVLFLAAATAAIVSSCSQSAESVIEDNSNNIETSQTPVNMSVYTASSTRVGDAGIITTPQDLVGKKGFGVFAYQTDGDDYNSSTKPNFMYNQQVEGDVATDKDKTDIRIDHFFANDEEQMEDRVYQIIKAIKEEGIETIKHLIFPVNKVDGLDIGKIFKIVRFPETAKEN